MKCVWLVLLEEFSLKLSSMHNKILEAWSSCSNDQQFLTEEAHLPNYKYRPRSAGQLLAICLKLSNDRFLLFPFPYISHCLSSHSTYLILV